MRVFRLAFCILAYMIIITSCKPKATTYDAVFSAYENIKKPMLFAPELSLKGNTYKGCFSHDYSDFYFFRFKTPDNEDYRIFQSAFRNNKWSEPEEVDFSEASSDLYPMVSTVEKNKLFFISYRRTPSDTSKKPNANFWQVTATDTGWTNPKPFETANLVYNYNSQPCMTNSGNIFFTSDTPDWSKTLTYKMEYINGEYQNPALFDFVNKLRITDTTRTYWEICMSPDESYMVMTISEKGKEAKLYVSFTVNKEWTTPAYIGDIIMEDMSGNFPYITRDGRFLIFTKEFSSFYILPTETFIKKTEN